MGTFEISVEAFARIRTIEKQFVKVDEKTHKIIEKKVHLVDSEGIEHSNHSELNFYQVFFITISLNLNIYLKFFLIRLGETKMLFLKMEK